MTSASPPVAIGHLTYRLVEVKLRLAHLRGDLRRLLLAGCPGWGKQIGTGEHDVGLG